MEINLYTASQSEGVRLSNFVKTINIDFIPTKDFRYFDKEENKVYAFSTIYFTETKISAVVSEQDETRVPIASHLF